MAISIDYATDVITIPQADLTLVAGTSYELDMNDLRLWLRALEDDPTMVTKPQVVSHVAPFTVAGQTLPRAVEILSPYTLTFEDVGSPYAVTLLDANTNASEPTVTNINQVSVRSQGLLVGLGGGWEIDADSPPAGSYGEAILQTRISASRAGSQRITIDGEPASGLGGGTP